MILAVFILVLAMIPMTLMFAGAALANRNYSSFAIQGLCCLLNTVNAISLWSLL